MGVMYVFRDLAASTWMRALRRLEDARLARDKVEVAGTYADLYAALVDLPARDLFEGAAQGLLWSASPPALAAPEPPEALLAGAARDLESLLPLIRRDWTLEVAEITGERVPALAPLVASMGGHVEALAERLRAAEPEEVLAYLRCRYREDGTGMLARHLAFRWSGGAPRGVAHPALPDLTRLIGVGEALRRLFENTEAFLAGRRAQHTLLYGPRGSGKSTALRGLLPRYANRGLRLLEVAPTALPNLPEMLELLRGRPHRYLLFVDDLSFEGDADYAPLKTLLEGSLTAHPENVLLCATSNRRHLVRERFRDRPDPLDDDAHVWDTQHERLALADRFGLVITFPDATQRRYLEIVRGLLARGQLEPPDLEARAVRFAEWGNGYSGRTAQQFVEALTSGLA